MAFREQNDAFPEYPDEDAGGSVFIFDPPPVVEAPEGEEGGDADPKGKTGGDKKKGGGDKKKGKKGEEEEEAPPAELPVSGFVLRMQAAV